VTVESDASGDVTRDGDRLVVPRAASLGDRCFLCGAPAAGAPIAMRLHVTNPYHRSFHSTTGSSLLLLLDLFAYLVFAISFLIDLPASRRRRIGFGLCAAHRMRRRLWRWGAGIAVLTGAVLVPFALVYPLASGPSAALFFGGLGLIYLAVLFSNVTAGPRLVAENPNAFWLAGAGKAFAGLYPDRAGTPPAAF
jgi:hypothetical protein